MHNHDIADAFAQSETMGMMPLKGLGDGFEYISFIDVAAEGEGVVRWSLSTEDGQWLLGDNGRCDGGFIIDPGSCSSHATLEDALQTLAASREAAAAAVQ